MNTPKPWKVIDCIANDHRGYISIQGPNGEKIADIFPFAGIGGVGLEQARANAALIVLLANALYRELIELRNLPTPPTDGDSGSDQGKQGGDGL